MWARALLLGVAGACGFFFWESLGLDDGVVLI